MFLPSPNSGLGKNKYTERFSIAFLFLGCLSSINGSEPFLIFLLHSGLNHFQNLAVLLHVILAKKHLSYHYNPLSHLQYHALNQ